MKKIDLNYTCLFGGGAIRGFAHVGAIKAMEEIGINVTNIGGSSVGAIVAGLLAVGYNWQEIGEYFKEVKFDLFRDINWGFGPNVAISKGEHFLEWIKELIEKKYYGQLYKRGENKPVTFKDLDKNLVIITTDLKNFECQEFSKIETPDYEVASAIRISCGMPGLMTPVEYNDKTLVDGDLQKSCPMWKLSKNLLVPNNRILEFRLEGEFEKDATNGLSFANAVYSCMTAKATDFISDIYGRKDNFDYIVLKTGDIVIVDFNISEDKRTDLINSGYIQTMEYFKKILPEKRNSIFKAYCVLQGHLCLIKRYFKSKNYTKMKYSLGDLFMNLVELQDIIDIFVYDDIKHFKTLIAENLSFGLMGYAKLKNEKLVSAELDKLCMNVDNKVDELALFLKAFDFKHSNSAKVVEPIKS